MHSLVSLVMVQKLALTRYLHPPSQGAWSVVDVMWCNSALPCPALPYPAFPPSLYSFISHLPGSTVKTPRPPRRYPAKPQSQRDPYPSR